MAGERRDSNVGRRVEGCGRGSYRQGNEMQADGGDFDRGLHLACAHSQSGQSSNRRASQPAGTLDHNSRTTPAFVAACRCLRLPKAGGAGRYSGAVMHGSKSQSLSTPTRWPPPTQSRSLVPPLRINSRYIPSTCLIPLHAVRLPIVVLLAPSASQSQCVSARRIPW